MRRSEKSHPSTLGTFNSAIIPLQVSPSPVPLRSIIVRREQADTPLLQGQLYVALSGLCFQSTPKSVS